MEFDFDLVFLLLDFRLVGVVYNFFVLLLIIFGFLVLILDLVFVLDLELFFFNVYK